MPFSKRFRPYHGKRFKRTNSRRLRLAALLKNEKSNCIDIDVHGNIQNERRMLIQERDRLVIERGDLIEQRDCLLKQQKVYQRRISELDSCGKYLVDVNQIYAIEFERLKTAMFELGSSIGPIPLPREYRGPSEFDEMQGCRNWYNGCPGSKNPMLLCQDA